MDHHLSLARWHLLYHIAQKCIKTVKTGSHNFRPFQHIVPKRKPIKSIRHPQERDQSHNRSETYSKRATLTVNRQVISDGPRYQVHFYTHRNKLTLDRMLRTQRHPHLQLATRTALGVGERRSERGASLSHKTHLFSPQWQAVLL
jgi:hypothetical protein